VDFFARLADEFKIIGLFGTVRDAEEKAFGVRQAVLVYSFFQDIKVGLIKPDCDAIKFNLSPFTALKSFHPAVQVRTFSPIENLGAVFRAFKVYVRNVFGS